MGGKNLYPFYTTLLSTVDFRNLIVLFWAETLAHWNPTSCQKQHPQLICSDLRLSNWKFEDWNYGNRPYEVYALPPAGARSEMMKIIKCQVELFKEAWKWAEEKNITVLHHFTIYSTYEVSIYSIISYYTTSYIILHYT